MLVTDAVIGIPVSCHRLNDVVEIGHIVGFSRNPLGEPLIAVQVNYGDAGPEVRTFHPTRVTPLSTEALEAIEAASKREGDQFMIGDGG